MRKPRIAVLLSKEMRRNCISEEDFQRLSNFAEVVYESEDAITEEIAIKWMENVDGCLTGWGTPVFSDTFLKVAPKLKVIAHSAGSVKLMLGKIIEQIKERNIVVTNAAVSLGKAVAEFTLGMMLMTMKRAWWFRDLTREGKWREETERKKVIEPYGITVGIIGASNVGRHLIKLLKQFDVKIMAYDPYLSEEEASALGVSKVSLENLMSCSDIVSLHAPATEETKHMINKTNLRLMKDGTIFINTARGSIVNEQDLIKELETGRITACLDVTDPEPPDINSPLRKLPNVVLTPHIAGAIANNRLRNGRYAVDELERFFRGEKILYEVNLSHWEHLG